MACNAASASVAVQHMITSASTAKQALITETSKCPTVFYMLLQVVPPDLSVLYSTADTLLCLQCSGARF